MNIIALSERWGLSPVEVGNLPARTIVEMTAYCLLVESNRDNADGKAGVLRDLM